MFFSLSINVSVDSFRFTQMNDSGPLARGTIDLFCKFFSFCTSTATPNGFWFGGHKHKSNTRTAHTHYLRIKHDKLFEERFSVGASIHVENFARFDQMLEIQSPLAVAAAAAAHNRVNRTAKDHVEVTSSITMFPLMRFTLCRCRQFIDLMRAFTNDMHTQSVVRRRRSEKKQKHGLCAPKNKMNKRNRIPSI